MLSVVPSCPCRVRGRREESSMVSLPPSLWDSTVCSHPKGTEGALCPTCRSSFLPSMSALFPPILQPSQSQYQGSGKLLPWGRGGACCGLSWKRKGLPCSCHLQGAGEVSVWPVLSFPTQGELSVPCCLLNICNRCKYLLLIYSLKELQSSVCVCAGGAGCAGCSSPAAQPK